MPTHIEYRTRGPRTGHDVIDAEPRPRRTTGAWWENA